MKIFRIAKDGGSESNVTGYWLIESKMFFSIALLRFNKGSREAFHNHAFDSLSWVLKGILKEIVKIGTYPVLGNILVIEQYYLPSIHPIYTTKDCMHQVQGITGTTWVLTFRGPWKNTWQEYLPKLNKYITLTNGRKIINENSNHRQSSQP